MYNVHMKKLVFEWNKRKENANIKKHGISFDEARTTFYDENAVQFFDPDHSDEEDRFILVGVSHRLNTLSCLPLLQGKRNHSSYHLSQKSRQR